MDAAVSARLAKFGLTGEGAIEGPAPKKATSGEREKAYQELKTRIHRKLIDKLDLSQIGAIPEQQLRAEVRKIVEELLDSESESLPVAGVNRERLLAEIQHETFGLGPLEPLLADPTISDILVNGHKQVYVERFGKLERTDTVFKDDDHLLHIIDRIVSQVGRRVDESSPMVDARLPDGSRVNAIIPPLAIDGPALSIRKFGVRKFTMEDLIEIGSLTRDMAVLMQGAVRARLNILISGGTGSGKTTFLNVLSSFVPGEERIVTIEDAAELQLHQEHVVRLETRPPNVEGKGAVTQRELLINALRMRPDRIIVGECRGAEAFDMLQAMNTGHDGSMTTLHANSPRDALRRLESMVLMATSNLPERAIREYMASAIDLVVQISRLSDGTRKVLSISEVTGMEGDTITMEDIFVYEKTGIAPDGTVVGSFKATGVRPKCTEKLKACGIELPPSMTFEPSILLEIHREHQQQDLEMHARKLMR
ncbi:MAG: CpaF family protein [candidate division KSB1 bacterium]|nr:CpaF family protein [candidate division KSB1 bacterium]MDZ7294004.1 CpaF family protein [candidate division KSB1 bacterium]